MKLSAISWSGVAGLPDGDADLTGQGGVPASLVAIAGPSGSGKSRLLEVIVHTKERLAPYGSGGPDALVTGGRDGAAKIRIDWWLSAAEQQAVGLRRTVCESEVLFPAARGMLSAKDPALIELLERYDHSPTTGKIDYVPPDRTRPRSATASGDFVADQKRKRLAGGSEKYAGIKRLVTDAARRRDARFVRLRALFSELCTGRQLGPLAEDGELTLTSAGSVRSLAVCSSSEWEAFAIAATMIFVGLERSIVLYDTPELHLDEREAARRISVLRTAFPEVQIVVATTAAALLSAAEKTVRLGGTT